MRVRYACQELYSLCFLSFACRLRIQQESASKIGIVDPVREYLSKLGKKGGKSRAQKLTEKQRSESARRAAQARWAKSKKKTNPPQ